ncbi:hypothetical protein FAVG1_06028 [Fusarium avenaceum]|nr:hypothetical protein FAVG1_06028 [Fusarium avenaceum]
MRLRCFTDIITRTPSIDKFRRDNRYAKVILPQHCQLQPIAHEIIAIAFAEPSIDDAHSPMTDTVQAHPYVSGQELIAMLRDLEHPKSDRRSDEKNSFLSFTRIALQRRHVKRRVACELARHERQKFISLSDLLSEFRKPFFFGLTPLSFFPTAAISGCI